MGNAIGLTVAAKGCRLMVLDTITVYPSLFDAACGQPPGAAQAPVALERARSLRQGAQRLRPQA